MSGVGWIGAAGGGIENSGAGAGGVGGGGEVTDAFGGGGNGEVAGDADALALELDVGEEERLVFDDGTGKRAAEHVPTEGGAGCGEEVARVELFVAKVFVGAAVEIVGAGAGGHGNSAAAGVAEFGGIDALVDLDFLDSFNGGIK